MFLLFNISFWHLLHRLSMFLFFSYPLSLQFTLPPLDDPTACPSHCWPTSALHYHSERMFVHFLSSSLWCFTLLLINDLQNRRIVITKSSTIICNRCCTSLMVQFSQTRLHATVSPGCFHVASALKFTLLHKDRRL